MQPDLFSYTPPQILGDRDGTTFSRSRDGARLNKQAQDVFDVMADGKWHDLEEVSLLTDHPEASVSARLRDLRKPKFGGRIIEKQCHGRGLWTYRMVDA